MGDLAAIALVLLAALQAITIARATARGTARAWRWAARLGRSVVLDYQGFRARRARARDAKHRRLERVKVETAGTLAEVVRDLQLELATLRAQIPSVARAAPEMPLAIYRVEGDPAVAQSMPAMSQASLEAMDERVKEHEDDLIEAALKREGISSGRKVHMPARYRGVS